LSFITSNIYTSTQHIWNRLSRSKNKAFSIVPTVFKPSHYLNPLQYGEDGNEHYMVNGIHVLRSQFTNVLKESLIELKKETLDWLNNKQKELSKSSNKSSFEDINKRFRINRFFDNPNYVS